MVHIKQNLIVDYLVISFKFRPEQSDCFFKFLVRNINFPLKDAQEARSYYGCSKCYYYCGIKLHVNSDLIVLDMSGKGCRTCEQLNPGFSWYGFLSLFDQQMTVPIKDSDYAMKGQFSVHIGRMDLACDLLEDKRITVPFLQKFVQARKFICKSDYHTCVVGNYEMAIYFGSPRSDRRLRIYDKAMEQGLTDVQWVRFEFQLRNDNALSFYLNLSQVCKGDFAKCYFGMLHDYLRFLTQPNVDTNRVRKATCRWWLTFLQGVGKIKQLYLPGNEYDIPAASKIYARQCSSTARLLMEAADGDVTELIKMAEGAKLNKKQREALRKHEKQKEDDQEQALWDDAAASNTAAILQILKEPTLNKLQIWKARENERKENERKEKERIEQVREHWKPFTAVGCLIGSGQNDEQQDEVEDGDLSFDI